MSDDAEPSRRTVDISVATPEEDEFFRMKEEQDTRSTPPLHKHQPYPFKPEKKTVRNS